MLSHLSAHLREERSRSLTEPSHFIACEEISTIKIWPYWGQSTTLVAAVATKRKMFPDV